MLKAAERRVSTTSFFGGYLPPEILQYVHLYCLARGVTKSDLVRIMAKDWKSKTKKEISEAVLFNEIVDMIQAEYEVTEFGKNVFIQKIREELNSKNIGLAYINGIMEAFLEGIK